MPEQTAKNTKRVLLINDLAGYGKVALSAMIPVFSHLRYDTCNLPTALVSNTLDYGHFRILDTTDYMQDTLAVWAKLGFRFDAICTGFLVSEAQASLLYTYCKAQKEAGTQIFVDPILGDDGKLYNGVAGAAVSYSQKLCSVADVIVPNITEACFLTGAAPKGRYTEEEITEILRQLHALGAKAVVITSTDLAGQMVTVVQDSPQTPWQALAYEEIPVRFPGTGDLFMAMMVGQYLKTGNLTASVHHAMQVLEQMIRANLHDSDKYKGIPVEQFLEVFCDEKA